MNKNTKKYLVIGLKKTGIETIKFLKNENIEVRGSDLSFANNLPVEINELYHSGIQIELGRHSDQYLEWCDEIVLSPGVSLNTPFAQKALASGKKVTGEIELAYQFIKKPIIAITGTNGKTTTTSLIGDILSRSGYKVFVGGNIGTPVISIAHRSPDYDFIVLETSSFQLQTIDRFKPHIAIFLNISSNHLDHHKDFNEYFRSKMNIFKNQTKGDWAIVNTDYPPIRNHLPSIKSKVVTFGQDADNELAITGNNLISFREDEFDLNGLILRGEHNLQNAMCAIAAAKLLGCKNKVIEDTIKSFKPLPHRIEYVGNHLGFDVYNDSKSTNPDATIKAIESVPSPIILLAGGKDKEMDYSVLKSALGSKVKHLILFGEARTRIKEQVGDCVCTTVVNSLNEAVRAAFSTSHDNVTLLFSPACSSFDMFESYEQRGGAFKEIVKNL